MPQRGFPDGRAWGQGGFLQSCRKLRGDAHVTRGQRGPPVPLHRTPRSGDTRDSEGVSDSGLTPRGSVSQCPVWRGPCCDLQVAVLIISWSWAIRGRVTLPVDTWSLATCSPEVAEHADSPSGSGPRCLIVCSSRSRASVCTGLTAGLTAGVDGSALVLPPAGVQPWVGADVLRPLPSGKWGQQRPAPQVGTGWEAMRRLG